MKNVLQINYSSRPDVIFKYFLMAFIKGNQIKSFTFSCFPEFLERWYWVIKLSWVNEEVHSVHIDMNLITVRLKPLNGKSCRNSGKHWPHPANPVLGTKRIYVLAVYKRAIAAAKLQVHDLQVRHQDPRE